MIEVRNIYKRFGKVVALDDVSTTFMPGQCTAVVGPNGSGKSTLIKSILGLVTPSKGQVYVNGTMLNGDCTYRQDIGYMPQAARFPQELKTGEVIEMITSLRENKPYKHEPLYDLSREWSKRVRTLSGGNRQKLSAVIATMFLPSILILDEPTAGLDPIASRHLKTYLHNERKRGTTIILTSHIMSELEELADNIVFLLDGRIKFSGSIDRIRAESSQDHLEAAIAQFLEGKQS